MWISGFLTGVCVRCRNLCFRRDSVIEVDPILAPNLWIGDCTSGPYYKRFDIVIDCTEGLNLSKRRRADYRLALKDIDDPDPGEYWKQQRAMLRAMKQIVPVMRDYLNNGKSVLVHCRAGKQRSAAIIAAYLMACLGTGPECAIKLLSLDHRLRGTFKPYCNFKWALVQYGWFLCYGPKASWQMRMNVTP